MSDGARPPAQQIEPKVYVPGGTFRMGSDDHYPEEAPVHSVTVGAFSMRATSITNREYATFVDATGYLTVAERPLDQADFPGAPADNLVRGRSFSR